MIFVVEMPDDAEPRCWFAYDERDLLRKVAVDDPLPIWQIHDRVSARELLALTDRTPESKGVDASDPALWSMAVEHGWDTPLYRADHLVEAGGYRREPISEGQACAAALRRRGDCRVYWNEAEATAAFERASDPAWQDGGWRARWALREQLLALEVLADDL